MLNINHFDSISQQLSRFELSYKSTLNDVEAAINDIQTQVKALNEHHDFSNDEIVTKLCEFYDISAKITYKNFTSGLKRYFKKLISTASSLYQYVNHEPIFHCVSQQHVNRTKALNGRFQIDFLYDYSAKKKNHAKTARHLSESIGLASLALKDGLEGYFLTVTLKGNKHYCSGESWDGTSLPEAGAILSKDFSHLVKIARKVRLKLECFRTINVHVKDGTPHLHGCLFTDDIKKLKELLEKAFSNLTTKVHLKKIRNVNESILYTIQELWDLTSSKGEKRTLARKSLKVRTFSKSSNVRLMAPVGLVEACRKGRFNSKRDLAAIRSYRDRISIDHNSYSITSLVESALIYNYAECTRIYSLFTNTRNYLPVNTSLALNTSASIDTNTLNSIDLSRGYLQTSSQVSVPKMKKMWDKMDAFGFEGDQFMTSIYKMLSVLQLKQSTEAMKMPLRAKYLLSYAGHLTLTNKASEIIEKSSLKSNLLNQNKYNSTIRNLRVFGLWSEEKPKGLFGLIMGGKTPERINDWLDTTTWSNTNMTFSLDNDPDYQCEFSISEYA